MYPSGRFCCLNGAGDRLAGAAVSRIGRLLFFRCNESLSPSLPSFLSPRQMSLPIDIDRESNKLNFHPLGWQLWSGSDTKGKPGGGQRPLTDCSLLTGKEEDPGAGKKLLSYGASTGSQVSARHSHPCCAVN